ncbi:MAG: TolC family protein [Synergistaceae bacterium]|jgi:multidrug efflux system outer membrane protein|nr:TolC family protein [Synergistaceae bacterium]
MTNMTRTIRIILCAIMVVSLSMPAEPSEPVKNVSLNEFLTLALSGNNMLIGEAKSLEAARYSTQASLGGQRTSLGAAIGGSYLSGQEQAGIRESDISGMDAGLVLTQPIDISGKFGLEERGAVLAYEMRRANLDNIINELMASAEESYWSAVLANENAALQRDILTQRVENLRVTEEKFKHDLVPKLDVIRADSLVAAAETLVSEAETERQNILASMALLVGDKDVAPEETSMAPPQFEPGSDLEEDAERRPDVRSGRLALQMADNAKKMAAKGMAPTLDATVNWVLYSQPSASSSPQMGEIVTSLRLNIPILDTSSKYEKLNAKMLEEAAGASLQHTLDTARMELTVARNNWHRAVALERGKRNEAERSNEELRITELMYKEGMGAQIDLINAQTENQRVRTEHLGAVKGMHSAIVQLRRAAGGYIPK